MADRVYIETTIVSYLTGRRSNHLVTAARQHLTHEWWDLSRSSFELCTAVLALDEAGKGDVQAAEERLRMLKSMLLLQTTKDAELLAKALVREKALPKKAEADALHIAVAAEQEIPYLLTWNCRHLNNAIMRPVIEAVCESLGYVAPIVCTPEQLMR